MHFRGIVAQIAYVYNYMLLEVVTRDRTPRVERVNFGHTSVIIRARNDKHTR